MAVYNIIYSSAADCSAAASSTTYSTARDSTIASSGDTAVSGPFAHTFATPNYNITQPFLVFDTSSVSAGAGTGFFSIYVHVFGGSTNSDTLRIREVSTVANKIAGGSLSALTLHADTGTFPPGVGRYTLPVSNVAAIPRSATFNVVLHSANEENNVTPTGPNGFNIRLSEESGTTFDPFLSLTVGTPWEFVGVGNVVEVSATAHTLVTTGITGTLQAGDLLIACISSRIASTTSITLPTGGEWTLVSEQKTNNTTASTSGIASGLMAYCVRGASNPNLTFTHPVAPSVALGRLIAYRGVNATSPKDTQTSSTTATATTAVSVTGLTTTQIEDLIVAMVGGGQEAAWSAFNATSPLGASAATVTTAPTTTWSERADSLTTAGADTSLAIFDAVKVTAGATGNFTATASIGGGHVVIAGAFKIAAPAVTGYTLTVLTGATVLAGQATTLRFGRAIIAETGATALSGQAAVLRRGYTLTASPGTIAVTGNDVNLTATVAQRLTALTGAISVAGQSVGLRVDRKLTALIGATTVTGVAAELRRGYLLTAIKGAITVSGQAVGLRRAYTLVTTTGAVALTGIAVGLRKGYSLITSTGVVTLVGESVSLRYNRVLIAIQGAITLVGNAVNLNKSAPGTLITLPGTITVAGNPVMLRRDYRLTALPGATELAGQMVDLRHGFASTAPPKYHVIVMA